MPYSLISVILGLLGLLSAYFVYLKVKSSSEGEGRVKEIGDEIHLGAMVFMSAEYKRLAIFCLVSESHCLRVKHPIIVAPTIPN